ncbi:MAG: DUF2723 domain-containing protein [Proteobacteria bacterium]|nr:DUF2723 domain-containing protein [Pseudomonadota bacterium]
MSKDKKYIMIGFGISFLIPFIIFLYTMAPTVSFWDCGEFISVATTLGIPHPPGTPLQVLIGRIFTMIPFGTEKAFWMNFYSVLSTSLASALLYLVFVRVVREIKNPSSNLEWLATIVSGAVAGITAVLLFSVWDNAVEAEVYGPSLVIMTLSLWLAIKWKDNIGHMGSKRMLLLIFYLAALSVGIHLMPLLVLPGVLLYILIIKPDELLDARLITASIILIFIGISTYAYLIIRARLNPYLNMVDPTNFHRLWAVFTRKQYGPMYLLPRKTDFADGMGPQIGTIPALLEQYKMYFRYFMWQLTPWPRVNANGIIPALSAIANFGFLSLGFYGMYEHYLKNKKSFALVFTTWFFTSIALVFYLNLKYSPSDPNPLHQPREVRERDYFYAPSYFFFTFYVGFAIWDFLMRIIKSGKKNFYYGAIGLACLLPVIPFASNFHDHPNRHGNWIADSYGHNMMSCPDPGSVLFTNGDNDTYPLWFYSYVKKYRLFIPKDEPTPRDLVYDSNYVREYKKLAKKYGGRVPMKGVYVANLSLLNTDWNLKQMKIAGVPISFTNKEIENLRPVRLQNGEILYVKDLALRDIIAWNVGYKLSPKELFATKKQFITNILPKIVERYKEGKSKINVYFAITVGEDSKAPYDTHLMLEGTTYKFVPESGYNMVNTQKTDSLLNKVFIYRGFNKHVIIDDVQWKLLSNYGLGYLLLGLSYKNQGQYNKAIDCLEKSAKFMKYNKSMILTELAALYVNADKIEKANKIMEEIKATDKQGYAYLSYKFGKAYMKKHKDKEALKYFNNAIVFAPNSPSGYAGMIEYYSDKKDTAKVDEVFNRGLKSYKSYQDYFVFFSREADTLNSIRVLNRWLKVNPSDSGAINLLSKLKADYKK